MVYEENETYYSESEQREEAVRRLRKLGVSEEEIEAFRTDGFIPVIEDSREGIKRGKECEYYQSFYQKGEEPLIKTRLMERLDKRLPYLIFDSRGVIPMAAVLFVEDVQEDTPLMQREFERKSDELILTALGASGGSRSAVIFPDCVEYGSIVVKLTEDGPVRVG